MRDEVEGWFRGIVGSDGPLRTKFDQYYLCLMLGLATGRSDKAANADEFVQYFVSDYAGVGRIIVALLVIAEADRLGIDISDKNDVKKLLNEYLDPTNPAHLSETGFQRLNDYANGGFSVLNEVFPERPRHVDMFLERYSVILKEKTRDSANWSQFQ
jgi:hypothetical protein